MGYGPGPGGPPGYLPPTVPRTSYPMGQPSFGHANQQSLTAMGVSALYLVLAAATHIFLLGIVPIILSVRAVSRREKLAPFAVLAAVVALVVGIAALRSR